MDMHQYLKGHAAEVPGWLKRVTARTRYFPRKAFLRSNVVLYPGAGTDGHPVAVFGSTHVAHCFIFVDHSIKIEEIEAKLADTVHGFKGYQSLLSLPLDQENITDHDWPAFGDAAISADVPALGKDEAMGLFEVLVRHPELDDSHGPERLAILFLRADAFAAYEALFIRGNDDMADTGEIVFPPLAVVIQDHGFGGNHGTFGRGGLLERMAVDEFFSPRWLLVADNSDAWSGYERVPDVEGSRGGVHQHMRHLFRQMEDPA